MRRVLVALGICCLALLVGQPLWASQSRDRANPAVQIARLEAQVADLQKRVRLQAQLDLLYNQDIHELQGRSPHVSFNTGSPALVAPGSWGDSTAGSCINGVLIGGGFHTDYPAMMGTSQSDGTSWKVSVYNAGSRTVLLSTQYACLTW
jgi:hypothetical protein